MTAYGDTGQIPELHYGAPFREEWDNADPCSKSSWLFLIMTEEQRDCAAEVAVPNGVVRRCIFAPTAQFGCPDRLEWILGTKLNSLRVFSRQNEVPTSRIEQVQ
jgi:hypothetical protein